MRSQEPSTFRQSLILVSTGLLWLGTIAVGYKKVWAYSTTAGAAAEAPAEWPSNVRHTRNAVGATVVILAHPRCPCTRATLSELASIAAKVPLRGYVFFLRPTEFDGDWAKTAIWKIAERIEGMVPVVDDDGIEAARFGARTSGQVVVYDRNGRLAFSGGITPSRGHVGESAGHRQIIAILEGERPDKAGSLVYGCALQDQQGDS